MNTFPFSTIEPSEFDKYIEETSTELTEERNYLRNLTIRKLRLEAISEFPLRFRRGSRPSIPTNGRDAFSDVPIDIIWQIFKRLHPLDLYHLTLTCKAFRSFLLDRDPETNGTATSVWEGSFERYPEVPKGPSVWQAEPTHSRAEWAMFLFGPTICQHCGKPGCDVYFGLLRKYCTRCAELFLVDGEEFFQVCKTRLRIKSYLVSPQSPSTDRKRLSFYGEVPSGERFYVRDHLQKSISIYMCRSTRKYQDMREDREEEARPFRSAGYAVDEWLDKLLKEHKKRQLLWYHKKSSEEFKKAGYAATDISKASNDVLKHLKALSKMERGLLQRGYEDFRIHIHSLRAFVDRARFNRLAKEYKQKIKVGLDDYQRSLPPSEWKHVPLGVLKFDEKYMSEKVLSVVDLPEGDFHSSLSAILSGWRERVREGLIRQLPSSIFERAAQPTLDNDTSGPTSPLDLAAAVFSCSRCAKTRPLGAGMVGWDTILTHMCCTKSARHAAIEWSPDGFSTALALLRCLGLDPRTTAAKDLDLLDPRFFCGHCKHKKSRGTIVQKAFRWRECITHSVYEGSPKHTTDPCWLLLGEDATQVVKTREKQMRYPCRDDYIWSCNHCAQNLNSPRTYQDIEEHVQEVHNIAAPEADRDIIDCPTHFEKGIPGRFKPRRPFLYETEPGWKYRCLHCPRSPPKPVATLWKEIHIFGHISDQHSISDPQDGRDWVRLDIYHNNETDLKK